jgi:hypothetical protein
MVVGKSFVDQQLSEFWILMERVMIDVNLRVARV